METITFNRILSQILEDEELNLTQYCKEINDLGVNITYPCLYSYYCGYTVPGFSKAKKILKASKIKYSNEELEEILEYSKKISTENNSEESRVMTLTLKIKPKLISKNFESNPLGLKSIIKLRSNELFSDKDLLTQFSAENKNKLSSYIAYLIKKDLIENKLIKEEEDGKQN